MKKEEKSSQVDGVKGERMNPVVMQKVGQQQIHDLLFGEQLSWQAIIYDLVSTEQLDPWDINLSLLSERFLERVRLLEEANFFISSKVLLAAALLLRMKSEILLQLDLPTLDAVLFGEKKEQKQYVQQRIELDEDVPDLVVRTPLPRYKKVTLDELMKALSQAITTENRRIKKIVVARQQEYETALSMPKQRLNLSEKLSDVHGRLKKIFEKREERLAFSEFIEGTNSMEERIFTFVPLLHLDHQHKVWLEQDGHMKEIWILLKHMYEKQNEAELKRMKEEAESAMAELSEEEKKRADEIEKNLQESFAEDEKNEGFARESKKSKKGYEDEE